MRKHVLIFGIIAGIIVISQGLYSVSQCYTNPNWQPNDVAGYAGMIVAFSLIFVGVKSYRDKHLEGVITFGKAFLTGLYITLVASAVYVIVWVIVYYLFVPDFMDKYTAFVLKQTAQEGGNTIEKAAEMQTFKDLYKNPLFVVLITFMEVFPVGLIISLVCALILKKKSRSNVEPITT